VSRNAPRLTSTRLVGHGLRAEGAAFFLFAPGKVQRRLIGNGPGRGLCECGDVSDELPNRAARKRWHREHKEQIKAQPA
jgi:hypothetical protein